MKQIILNTMLIAFLFDTNILYGQRKIESSKVLVIEQEGDSVFCREKEICFEVLDFEFDSCDFYNNRYFLTFRLINQTEYMLALHSTYISWYDTSSLRPKGYKMQTLGPRQSMLLELESVPYGKKRMNSPGTVLINYEKKELRVPIRLKQESSKVTRCREGQELVK